MPLSEDQRALLRLLAGGDTYEQVAGLLGTTPSSIRERAGEAVAELESEESDPETAGAVRARMRELEGGTLPPSAPAAPEGSRRELPRLAWITIALAVVAIAAAFLVVRSGDDSGQPGPAPKQDSQEDVVDVKLEPAPGSQASGTARIIRVEDLPAIDVHISGLTPTREGETYVLWLLGSGDEGLPIAFRQVGAEGKFVGRTRVPTAAAGLLPSIEFIDLSLAREREATAAIRAAAQAKTLPARAGRSVVRGSLPG